jgi:hypothetical protein
METAQPPAKGYYETLRDMKTEYGHTLGNNDDNNMTLDYGPRESCFGCCVRQRYKVFTIIFLLGIVCAIVGGVLCLLVPQERVMGIVLAVSGIALVVVGLLLTGVAESHVKNLERERNQMQRYQNTSVVVTDAEFSTNDIEFEANL